GLFDQLHQLILHGFVLAPVVASRLPANVRAGSVGDLRESADRSTSRNRSSTPVLASPASDCGVIAAQEDFGNVSPAERPGACVMGIFQATVRPERFIGGALGVAQGSGDQ